MALLASFLVGKPLTVFVIAVAFLVRHFLVRLSVKDSARHPRTFWVVAAAWGLYAAWERLVVNRTPEANNRIDLLLIRPVVLIISIWFVIRAFR